MIHNNASAAILQFAFKAVTVVFILYTDYHSSIHTVDVVARRIIGD